MGGRCTFQLACYPGGGARYVRHADRSPSAPTRRVTALFYLNPAWRPEVREEEEEEQEALGGAAHSAARGRRAWGGGKGVPGSSALGVMLGVKFLS